MADGFPSQRVSNAGKISIWWHHEMTSSHVSVTTLTAIPHSPIGTEGEKKRRLFYPSVAYMALGAAPEPLRHRRQRRFETLKMVDQVACITHEQLTTSVTHGAIFFMEVHLVDKARNNPWEIITTNLTLVIVQSFHNMVIFPVILKLTLVMDGWSISDKIVLRWMSLELIHDKLTLVQVTTWCHQATGH